MRLLSPIFKLKKLFTFFNHNLIIGTIFFIFVFTIYLLNGRSIPNLDTYASRHLPICIILHNSITFNGIEYISKPIFDGGEIWSFFVHRGKIFTLYPLGTGVMALPIYLFCKLVRFQLSGPDLFSVEKISASVITTLAALFLAVLLLKLHVRKWIAWVGGILFALGTLNWTVSSQALWQHGPQQLSIIVGLLALASIEDANSIIKKIFLSSLAGIAFSFAYFCRPTFIAQLPFWFALYLFCIAKRETKLRALLMSGVFFLCLLIFPAINGIISLHYFSSLKGPLAEQAFRVGFNAKEPIWYALATLIFAPGWGLFWQSGFLVIGSIFTILLGVIRLFKKPADTINRFKNSHIWWWIITATLASISHLLIISRYQHWSAANSFGPRYLSDIFPALFIITFIGLENALLKFRQLAKSIYTAVMSIFSLLAIGLQAFGAFYFYWGWSGDTKNLYRTDQFWKWSESQIPYIATNGRSLQTIPKSENLILYPGKTIAAGTENFARHLGIGFHKMEKDLVWTRFPSADFFFSIPKGLHSPKLIIQLIIPGDFSRWKKKTHVSISCNDKTAEIIRQPGISWPPPTIIILPIKNSPAIQYFTIHTSRLFYPWDSTDQRNLGVPLIAVTLIDEQYGKSGGKAGKGKSGAVLDRGSFGDKRKIKALGNL